MMGSICLICRIFLTFMMFPSYGSLADGAGTVFEVVVICPLIRLMEMYYVVRFTIR